MDTDHAGEPSWLGLMRKNLKNEDHGKENHDKKPFDFDVLKKYINMEVLNGNISDDIAKQILEHAQKKDGAIEEVPAGEDPADYPILKKWSERLYASIPRVIKLESTDDKNREDFRLDRPPYIITLRMRELDACSGRILNPDDGVYHYFIGLDTGLRYFIHRIAETGQRLFDAKNTDFKDFKQLVDKNIERDPDIYKYFRDAYYHFMFYGNEKIGDENISKIFIEEVFGKMTGFLPPPGLNSRLFLHIGMVIMDGMGLFIMGHEYAHIILDLMGCDHSDYDDPIARNYQKEFHADSWGLRLMWDCIRREYNNDPYKRTQAQFCFVGVMIFLNCVYIKDRMKGLLDGSQDAIVHNSHPPASIRMECIRQCINEISGRDDFVEVLDAVDYIFNKLGDSMIDELSNNINFKKYIESIHQKKEEQTAGVFDLIKIKAQSDIPVDGINDDIIKKCESILGYDPNNVRILFALGSVYIENREDDKAFELFMKVANISQENISHNRPFYRSQLYGSMYYIGCYYTHKVGLILQKSNSDPDPDQEKKIAELLDKSIVFFETAIPYYNNNGWAFYDLGVAFSFKNEHQKAIENFKKALQYQPNNPQILSAIQLLYLQEGRGKV
jgi:tetratricopeptide (TPR) repeat protein